MFCLLFENIFADMNAVIGTERIAPILEESPEISSMDKYAELNSWYLPKSNEYR